MAGERGRGNSWIAKGGSAPPAGASAKTFECRHCGGTMVLRYPGQSLAIVCERCLAVADATDPSFEIISRYQGKRKAQATLEIGSRGRLRGATYEVLALVEKC